MPTVMILIYVLLLVIVTLAIFVVLQIKLAGIHIVDFWDFIKANEELDKLYRFSKYYATMSQQEQVIFLTEAEKVFSAFDKMPSLVWEEEYSKYRDVLEAYRNIKLARWNAK